MKNLRILSWRDEADRVADVLSASARRPFRLWMTGSLAVVMAALCTSQAVRLDERGNGNRVLRHSRYSVNETVARIEAAALGGGLSVLARVRGAQPVIVLESSVGGTLVVMHDAGSRIDVPMSVQVLAADDGGAHVLMAPPPGRLAEPWTQLPAAAVQDFSNLHGFVERALI